MAFSGALTLTDLNDFISPSQACIKPVEQTHGKVREEEYGGAKTEIVVDSTGSYYEVTSGAVELNPTLPSSRINDERSGTKLEQAQISLNDCLACSGCITSAESVLITLQSHVEVFTFLEHNTDACNDTKKLPVLSIAPQSLASLATALTASLSSSSTSPISPITPLQVLRRVTAFCNSIGFPHVFDVTFARQLALAEHVLEFEERKAMDTKGGEGSQGALPMLASACPGWICYAEKAHAEMLPFVAKTKSPQQIMGTLVKEWLGKRKGLTPDKVYHVSVMPCYDKKLEASRQDFYNDMYSTRDVDCVITTGELELMMKERGWDLSLPIPSELEEDIRAGPPPQSLLNGGGNEIRFPELLQQPGSSSGSYLHSIIFHLQRVSDVQLTLSSKLMRNADYEEFLLTSPTGKIVFKGAKCYGFRNLQNVVRKVGRERGVRTAGGAAGRIAGRTAGGGIRARMKKKASAPVNGSRSEENAEDKGYDYVEVMACPGGCVNGGGQLKPVLPINGNQTSTMNTSAAAGVSVDSEGYPRDWEQTGVAFQSGGIAGPAPGPSESGIIGASSDGSATTTGGLGISDMNGFDAKEAEKGEKSGGEGGTGTGVETVQVPGGVVMNAKWGDKDWTKRVEATYWLTGISSPSAISDLGKGQEEGMGQGNPGQGTEGENETHPGRIGIAGRDWVGQGNGIRNPGASGEVAIKMDDDVDGVIRRPPHDLPAGPPASSAGSTRQQQVIAAFGSGDVDMDGSDDGLGPRGGIGGAREAPRVEVGMNVPIGRRVSGEEGRRQEGKQGKKREDDGSLNVKLQEGGAVRDWSKGSTEKEGRTSAQDLDFRRMKWANELAARVLSELCESDDDGVKTRHRLFRTEYHAVESEVGNGLAVKW